MEKESAQVMVVTIEEEVVVMVTEEESSSSFKHPHMVGLSRYLGSETCEYKRNFWRKRFTPFGNSIQISQTND
uniref:Uncharacterized protein n=1 Tax=Solanum lycopersicum TaxID=4081 RepID=A0A3Q7GYP7_SOLLC